MARLGGTVAARRPGRRRPVSFAPLFAAAMLFARPAIAEFDAARFGHYGIAEGLSQSSVTALAQDPRGFLWVGTLDGLDRFDGYAFRHFRPDPDRDDALPDGSITALAAHPDGSVWVGTMNGGIARYDPGADAFTVLDEIAGSARAVAMLIDGDGGVWAGSDRGLAHSTPESSARLAFDELDQRPVSSLALAADGDVWVGRTDGSVEVFGSDGTPRSAALTPDAARPDLGALRAMTANPAGGMWVAGDGPRFALVDASGALQHRYALAPPGGAANVRLRSLATDREGRLWLGGLGLGIAVFDPRSGTTRYRRHAEFDRHSLSHDDVAALWRDETDTLWVGTLSGGLNALRLRETGFAHYQHRPGDPSSLTQNTVTSFADGLDGTVWVGTDGGGLNRMDLARGTFLRVPLHESESLVTGLSRVWSLHVDRAGGLWVGTWGAGLYRRAPRAARFEKVETPGSIISVMLETDEGVWAGTSAGLLLVGRDGTPRRRWLESRNVTALARAGGSMIWVGTWTAGLYLLDVDTGRVEHFVRTRDDPSTLPHDSVRALGTDRAGALWVGTRDGLARFVAETRRFHRFRGVADIPEGTIYGIEFDTRDRVWISTNAGLVRFEPAPMVARIFGPEDGVQDFEFNGGAHARLRDGRLLFGGLNGFNLIDPARIEVAPPPRPVQIVDVRLDNVSIVERNFRSRPRQPAAPMLLRSLQLRPHDTVVELHFVSPMPIAPVRTSYAFRLEGFDDDWHLAKADERVATYMNLAPGEYGFRVRARNADGLWSTSDRTLALQVLPPWWATGWAFAMYALLGIIGLVTVIQWRTHALRAHARELQTSVEERTAQLARQTRIIEEQARHLEQALATKERLFARVSHEFRTPLTLIVGPIDTLLADERRGRNAAWLRLMRRYARRLLALVDQLLGLATLSDESTPKLSPQPLAPVVRGTLAAFQSVAVARNVRLEAGRLDDAWVRATPELLERIVTNLVSNAVKYTRAGGRVHLSLRSEHGRVQLLVSDDGPGIQLEEQALIFEPFHRAGTDGQGTGLGLALVRECAEALGGSVALDSEPGRGSTFTVRLPPCREPVAGATQAGAAAELADRPALEAEVVGDALLAPDDHGLFGALADVLPAEDRPRILLVEDNADLRTLLLATLAPNYRCATARNGRLGIEAALEDPPDLVVSDVMMPEVDGYELTRALKSDDRTSHVPIILLTALGDRAARLHGLEERADDFVVKPFDMEDFLLRVRNLIESRQILRRRAGRLLYSEPAASVDPDSRPDDGLGPRERSFLGRLHAAALAGHADLSFGVRELAGRVAMSERQLQRKLRSLLGVTPAEYLRELRLQKSTVLLRKGEAPASVALGVGFSSQSHFGACFKARFGVTPGAYARPRVDE
jgi:signal transduction histidine kinase/CheY-like chemotaxis protein/streptogramin lyase